MLFLSCPKKLSDNKVARHVAEQVLGSYGDLAQEFLAESNADYLSPVGYTQNLWAELQWAAKYEQVIHLDDLLLRRTRVGHLLPQGGLNKLEKIKQVCQSLLGWTEQHWQAEVSRYQKLWQSCYSLPRDRKLVM